MIPLVFEIETRIGQEASEVWRAPFTIEDIVKKGRAPGMKSILYVVLFAADQRCGS
jgi:hypothetical protein